MDVGTWIRFCKDFHIFGDPRSDQERVLTRDELIQIFKRNASFQREMLFENFLTGLDDVAELYYNEDFDEKNP
jgi:hypothetical protein